MTTWHTRIGFFERQQGTVLTTDLQVQLVEVVKELDSMEVSVRLQPHLPIQTLQDDEA